MCLFPSKDDKNLGKLSWVDFYSLLTLSFNLCDEIYLKSDSSIHLLWIMDASFRIS
jgi:hypothetical protein